MGFDRFRRPIRSAGLITLRARSRGRVQIRSDFLVLVERSIEKAYEIR